MPQRTRPSCLTLAALGVPVLLGHVLVIDTFRGLMQPPSALHDMAEPLYTRVLLPQPPVDVLGAPPSAVGTAAAVSEPPQAVFREPPVAPEWPAAPVKRAAASQARPSVDAPKPQTPPKTPEAPVSPPPPSESAASAPSPDVQLAQAAPAPQPALEAAGLDEPTLEEAALAQAPPPMAAPAELAESHPVADPPPVLGPSQASDGTSPPLHHDGNPSAAAPSSVAPALAAASAAFSTAATASAAASTPATTDGSGWPPDTRLNYRLGGNYRGELHGTARVTWQKNGGQYQARVDLDVGFLVSMTLTSQGRFTANHLLPQAYEEVVRKKRRSITLDDSSVQLANGERVPRPAQVQDTASQFIELSHRFASGQQALQVGQQVHFALARPNRLAQWTYDVVEETELHLPTLGPTRAFLVRPRPSDGDTKGVSAQMWLAPSLNHLPVRILLTLGDDKQVDLMLERIDQAER